MSAHQVKGFKKISEISISRQLYKSDDKPSEQKRFDKVVYFYLYIFILWLTLFFFYISRLAVETPEEWVQRWKNECHNVRDADDLVQDLSNRIISAQKVILNRKRIGDI